jgi:glycosyltransferase involved in cell wall biosynthesis
MKLSILICTLEERKLQYDNLRSSLFSQYCLLPQYQESVEILSCCDNREMSVGAKRNALLKQSTGNFLVFIDDDDSIHPNYIKLVLEALQSNPDCVGLNGIITFNGTNPRKFVHSIKVNEWYESDGVYYRYPNHLNPVKRELALQVGFPECNFGEDKNYSDRLKPLLKTEVMIDTPIYFYNYDDKKSATANRK